MPEQGEIGQTTQDKRPARTSTKTCWVGCLVVAVAAALALFVAFSKLRPMAWQPACRANLLQIGLGMLMFANDNDGQLPNAHRWEEQIFPYIRNDETFGCPAVGRNKHSGYAMNPRFSGAKIEDFDNPGDLIIAYDADEFGRPVARHLGQISCLFLDVHVEWFDTIPVQISTGPYIPPLSKDDPFWESHSLPRGSDAQDP